MSIEQLYQLYLQYPSVQTDTRKLRKNDLFFALKGENFNGNDFVAAALEAGASWAVIDDPSKMVDGKTFLVADVLKALQQLAGHHRDQFSIPFIAITGSNGKTTTKELIHAVLSEKYKTYTTEGNLNNHIGIPLTLLKIKPDAEIAVIEMGANHQQEIASYCVYTRPTHGLITNCGKAHLEGFGGEAGVRKGKGELFDYLRETGGTVFIMNDYGYLREMAHDIATVFTYGTKDAATMGTMITSEPFLSLAINGEPVIEKIDTHLVGDYNLPNILAAVTVGHHFGVTPEAIRKAIENYIPSNSRSQLVEKGSNHIILDAYNANPSSMRLAIENFARIRAQHKILLLGSMAELGDESVAEHEGIVNLIRQYHWDQVVLVGKEFAKLTHPFIQLGNAQEAKQWLQQQAPENAYLLVKGSRSMQMEKVLE